MAETGTKIRTLFIDGPTGRLEALLNEGAGDAGYAALVCHPHPLYGGTMHNKVVYHAAKAINGFGFPVLRFNFRGAGLSEGKHDRGHGERDDVRAALAWLKNEFGRPIIFCGFSFGAAVGLKTSCPDPDVKLLISLGTPVAAEGRAYTYRYLTGCPKPKLFVSGDHDQYGSLAELEQVMALAAESKKFIIIPNADHFFAGQLAAMRDAIESWLTEQLGTPAP